MKKTLTLLVSVLVLAAAGYYGYLWYQGPAQSLQLVTATVTRGDVVESIDATGRLEAVTTVLVGSQVSGNVSALYADFNSRVRAGQVVARLEPSLFETQIEQSRANLIRVEAEVERSRVQFEDAEIKLARARDLTAKQLVPSTDLETAEANARGAAAALKGAEAQVVQSQASLNQSEVNLSHTVITAPIDGVVISRNVDVGQTVAASMSAPTLFEIANDLAEMQVNTNIDEADIGRIEAGQPVTFQVDAYPGDTFTGTVSQVRLNPVIESNVVSYVTIIDVPNEDMRLRPGMTATVTVEVERASDTLRVPMSALRFNPTPELFAALGQPVPGETDAPAGEEILADAAATQAEAPIREVAAAPEGFGDRGGGGLSDEDRAAFRERLGQMSPEERQAAIAVRGGGRGGGGGGGGAAAAQRGATGGRASDQGQIWVVVDGQLEQVPVRAGLSDGAAVAVTSNRLQEDVVVATGMVETTVAAATGPPAGNPLLPQFGRRGRGGGGGGGRGGR